jgi:hypothetical protein
MVLEDTLGLPDEMLGSLEHRIGYPIAIQFKCYDGSLFPDIYRHFGAG